MNSSKLFFVFFLVLSCANFVFSQYVNINVWCSQASCGGQQTTTLSVSVQAIQSNFCFPSASLGGICEFIGSYNFQMIGSVVVWFFYMDGSCIMLEGSSGVSCSQCNFLNHPITAGLMITPSCSTTTTATPTTLTTSTTTSGITTTSTSGLTTTTTSTSGGPISPKLDEYCYNLTTSVSKELQGSPQYFTLQDFGCNTTDWNIVSVNTTTLYSYQDPNQVKLVIQPNESGVRPVHYQIMSSDNQYVHTIKTKIDIVNHRPVINNATFTWHYPRTTTTFPNWNLLSNCTDQDGDSLSVVQIQKTPARTESSIVQLNDTVLYFVPEKVVLSVLPTGGISLTAPSNTNPVKAGSPLALFWKQSISFQFQITDGDVTKEHAWGTANINYS